MKNTNSQGLVPTTICCSPENSRLSIDLVVILGVNVRTSNGMSEESKYPQYGEPVPFVVQRENSYMNGKASRSD